MADKRLGTCDLCKIPIFGDPEDPMMARCHHCTKILALAGQTNEEDKMKLTFEAATAEDLHVQIANYLDAVTADPIKFQAPDKEVVTTADLKEQLAEKPATDVEVPAKPKKPTKMTAEELKEKRRLAGIKGRETRKANEAARKAEADAAKGEVPEGVTKPGEKMPTTADARKAERQKRAEMSQEDRQAADKAHFEPEAPAKGNGAGEPAALTYEGDVKPVMQKAIAAIKSTTPKGSDPDYSVIKELLADYEVENGSQLDVSQLRSFLTDLQQIDLG